MKNINKNLIGKIKVVKSSFTGGSITRYSGINVVGKFLHRQKIGQRLNRLFPTIWYNATKFGTVQILMSIIFASLAGINRIKRIANFTRDPLIKVNLRLQKAINENAISGVLKKLGQKGARVLQKYLLSYKSNILKNSKFTNITLDADSTVSIVYGNQEGAEKGFNSKKKGAKSYHPLLVFVSELKILYNTWFRAGAAHTSNGITEFLKETRASLPGTINNVFFRADSGYFGGKLLALLENFGWDYLIKVKLKNLKQLLNNQSWAVVKGQPGVWICEFEYTTISWNGKVRNFKAVRTVKEYVKKDYFGKTEYVPVYQYACYVSSYTEKDATELHEIYKQRSTSETWIEEVKSQLLAGKTLTDDFWANDILWQLNCFAYNISVIMRNKHKKLSRQEHKTFRDWFILVPAKLISGGHTKEIKLYENYYCKSNWLEFENFLDAS
jgi:hypothetical protein